MDASPLKTAAPKAEATCGTKPRPDCPLQAWMKAEATPAVLSKDYAALAAVLDRTAELAPPGYANWVSISRDGARAARSADVEAAKAACRGCHDQYAQAYRSEMRERPL